MALTDESNGNGFYMPVAPAYMGGGYGNSGFGGFGGDWGWIVLLLLLAGGNGWGFGGGYGGGFNNALGYDFPWLLNGQNGINANTNAGFQNAMLNDGITSIRDGINALQTQLCGCCSDTQMALANGFAGVEQGANARQIANMQSMFGIQSALQNCCCENRANIADLKFTVATEACADRQAVNDALRDVLTANTASTQRILDQLCQDKIDAKNDTIAQLRQELLFARGQASQDVQTAELRANNATVANQLLSEMRSCPIPAQPVYGSQPIFTCGSNNCGCNCGCGVG